MKLRCIAIMLGTLFLFGGCSSDSEQEDQFLVRVNSFGITNAEVNVLLKFETTLDSSFHLSEDVRANFINNFIQTQLLIQEASKRKLDQREGFRQTIQRYWESTLIRDLLEEKGRQLRKTTIVSKEEVETYYRLNKNILENKSLEELWPQLTKQLEDKKVTLFLQKWIEELRAGASIEINDPDLAAKVIGANEEKRKSVRK
jgi:hypothetical protein